MKITKHVWAGVNDGLSVGDINFYLSFLNIGHFMGLTLRGCGDWQAASTPAVRNQIS